MKISKERRNQFFRRVVFPSPLDPHPFLATTGGNPPVSLSCRFPCHSARGSVLCLGNATVIPPGKTKHRSNCRYRGWLPVRFRRKTPVLLQVYFGNRLREILSGIFYGSECVFAAEQECHCGWRIYYVRYERISFR